MKKFLMFMTAFCAMTMFVFYCVNPDFNNPLDPKNSGSAGGEFCRWDGDPYSCLRIEDGMAPPPQDHLTNRENCIVNSTANLVFPSEASCRAWEPSAVLVSCFWEYNPPHNLSAACWDRSRTVEKCIEEYGTVVSTCVPMCSRCDNIFDCVESYSNGCVLNGGPKNWNEATTVCTQGEDCPTDIGSCAVGGNCERGVQRNVCAGVFDISGECQAASAPAAPTGVTATAVSSTSIRVSWNAVTGTSGAESYRVYRSASSSGTYSQIGTSTSTTYTDNGLTANTRYYYRVVAVNGAGQSAQSSAVSATTLEESGGSYTYYCPLNCAEQTGASIPSNCFAEQEACELVSVIPNAPSNVRASAVSSAYRIKIDWDAAAGATSYTIYRNLNADSVSWFAEVGTATTLTFTDNNLTAGREYFYAVRANNTAGSSGYSEIANATVIPPTGSGPHYMYCCWAPNDHPNGECHPIGPGETIFGNKSGEADCRADYGMPSATDQTGTMTVDWCRWDGECFPILPDANAVTERQNCRQYSAPRQTFSSLNACMAWESDEEFVNCFWGYDPYNNNGASCWGGGSKTRDECLEENGNIVNSCTPLCNQCSTVTPCPERNENGCNMIGGPYNPPTGMTVLEY